LKSWVKNTKTTTHHPKRTFGSR